MANELQMLTLLFEKYETEVLKGEDGVTGKIKQQIDDLSGAVAGRLQSGETLAVEESAKILLLADAFEERIKAHAKKEPNAQIRQRIESRARDCVYMVMIIRTVMALYAPQGTEQAVENAITKIELEKSIAT